MLGPCLGHLCWNDFKMPFCPPRAPSWSPKPHKNRGFSTSPRWNSLPPKGPKHRKNRCFFNAVSKIHRKLQWLSTVNQGWVGGEGSAYNLRLPPKASGKDTQSGPMLSTGCAHVWPSRAHVEPSCAHLGLMLLEPSWARLGLILGQVGPMLSWAHLGPTLAQVGPTLGLCWAYVGLCWAYVGPCWALLAAMLGPCLGHLCWNDLKMPFCPPRAPSWSPKPRINAIYKCLFLDVTGKVFSSVYMMASYGIHLVIYLVFWQESEFKRLMSSLGGFSSKDCNDCCWVVPSGCLSETQYAGDVIKCFISIHSRDFKL